MTSQTIDNPEWNAQVEQLLTEARDRPADDLLRQLMNRLHEARLGVWAQRKQVAADQAARKAAAALDRERQPEWDRQRDALRDLVIATAAEVAAADREGAFDRHAFARLMQASAGLSEHLYDAPRRVAEGKARLVAAEATDREIQAERRGASEVS